MISFSAKLDQLESRLQTLIEGRLARLLPGRENRDRFVQHLVYAMETGSQTRADGVILAPDVYVLLVHPDNSPGIESNPRLLDELSNTIHQVGLNADLVFTQSPVVYVSANAEVGKDSIDVVARISLDGLGETVEATSQKVPENQNIPQNAFLIVNGVKIFSLRASVVNIGRRKDNDLVIDDPRVSRAHAQLRAARGAYALFDLGSKGGTFVNNQRIDQRTLVPQDVISLAGVPLVFGQDAGSEAALDQTQEMKPLSLHESPDDGDQSLDGDGQ